MTILPGTKAPWFSSVGYQESKFFYIRINDLSSDRKWLVFFFYLLNFDNIAPSQLLELKARRGGLDNFGCRCISCSCS